MHAIGLLIVSFFLFDTEKNLRDLNITYYNNKMRPYHDIEYFWSWRWLKWRIHDSKIS